jgi:hypothetical protein
MHPLYRDLFLAQAQAAIAAARSVSRVPHNGLKGQLREIVVRELLRPLLPTEFVLTTGQIVSTYGDTSHQVDVAACDRRLVPPVLFEGGCGILPLEATLFALEVKSVLTLAELSKAQADARLVSAFRYAPPIGATTWPDNHHIEGVVSYMVAFDTDLAVGGKSEIARYQELLNGDAPSIRGLCVVGRGFWFYAGDKWWEWRLPEPGGELAMMVAAIINTVQRVAGTRRQADVRHYLE